MEVTLWALTFGMIGLTLGLIVVSLRLRRTLRYLADLYEVVDHHLDWHHEMILRKGGAGEKRDAVVRYPPVDLRRSSRPPLP